MRRPWVAGALGAWAQLMVKRAAVAGVLVSSVAGLLVSGTSQATAADAVPPSQLVAVDRARAVGLQGIRTETYAAVPVDYDRNGRQDVWIGYHGLGAKLWRNRGGGTYTRVARSTWPRNSENRRHIDRHDCTWGDVDRNGLPDAYCSTGRMLRNVVKFHRGNELWLQVRRGRFREVGTEWGVDDLCGRGRQVTFINVNGDRWPDLFLSNDIPRRDRDDPCNVTANRLPNERGKVFLNVRGRRFQYVKRLWNFGPGIGTRCAEPLDFDRDGWQDLLACLGPNESPRLYRNRSGRGFADVTSRYPLSQGMSDAVVVDLDRDGDRDVVSSSADGFGYYQSVRGDLGPRVLIGTVASGQGGSVAVGDADGDGDNDVYGLTWQGRTVNPDDQIWINHLGSFVPIAVPSAQGAG